MISDERNLHRHTSIGGGFMEMIRVITTAGVAERSQYMETIVNFGAYARENWVAEKAASLQNCSKVLDVGAGQCPYRKLFGHCDYKTQDFAGYHGSASASEKERWNYGDIDYVCDINAIPVPDKSFDAVLCTEVLEHVPEPMAAVAEFGRILVRGGRLFLTAPLGSGLHQQPFHYYGGYTPYFYQRVLAQSNFEIVEIRPIGGLLKHVGQEIYRVGRMIASKAPQHLSLLTRLILLYWLPRRLARLEKDVFVEEFTVGYLVEARRL